MVQALILKIYVSLQKEGLACDIFDNNYDLEECVFIEVVEIIDISYWLQLTSLQQLFPGLSLLLANLFAWKMPRRRCLLLFHISYLHCFALGVVCWWKILSKINFAGFFGCLVSLPCVPAASGGCRRLGGAHRPSDGRAGPGLAAPRRCAGCAALGNNSRGSGSSRCCGIFSL